MADYGAHAVYGHNLSWQTSPHRHLCQNALFSASNLVQLNRENCHTAKAFQDRLLSGQRSFAANHHAFFR